MTVQPGHQRAIQVHACCKKASNNGHKSSRAFNFRTLLVQITRQTTGIKLLLRKLRMAVRQFALDYRRAIKVEIVAAG
jgi:hypothetical protein